MKKPSSHKNSNDRGHRGFTLVELLVVIVIIGLLMAVLIPAIGSSMRAARRATITNEISAISQNLDRFATDNGSTFPPAFVDPVVTNQQQELQRQRFHQFMAQLYRYRDANGDTPSLPDGSGFVDFANLDCAEAWVLWLMGTTDNKQYPLCGRANNNASRVVVLWIPPENANLNVEVASRNSLLEFDQTRLRDMDGDGFPEYYPAHGGSGGNVEPYIYYPNTEYQRTYWTLDAQPRYYVNLRDPSRQRLAPLPYLANLPADLKQGNTTAIHVRERLTFAEPKRFQVLAPGLDGKYLAAGAESQQSQTIRAYEFPNGPYTGGNAQTLNDTAHRDNITNFAGGTLESKMP